jgi:DNA adenine methylase
MKSPLKWVGGKSRLVDTILPLIPQHAHYAEAFCGAGWVFFRKPESRYESINDINKDLTTFYRVLKHHLHPFVEEFRWMLTSREFFEDFQNHRRPEG